MYYSGGVPLGAEYDVLADMTVVTQPAASYAEIAGRISTSAETLYEGGWEQGNGWVLYKGIAGAYTNLGTSAFTPTNGVTYALKLVIRNAAKTLYVNGVQQLTSADNTIATAGRAGLDLHIASQTTGQHLDNFLARDPVAPPPPRRPTVTWQCTRRF